jgi:putative glutamine amidotransferase
MRPVIGITAGILRDEQPYGTVVRYVGTATYLNAVAAAGGLPVVLPPQDGGTNDLLDLIDGLLLSGGGDIEPSRYGETAIHPKTYGIEPLRDAFEFALVEEAIRRDMPTFGICRGIQVLNVALGGTLFQDVPDLVSDRLGHEQHKSGVAKEAVGHAVTPTAGSPLTRLYGDAPVGVNSFHHQAVRDPAPGLEIAGRSEDGVIEAVTHRDRTFVLGVQWHPEMMFEQHPEQLAPFKALVDAALAHRLAGRLA